MLTRTRRTESDHGAVLVHTAIGLLALMAFGTFVIDYGVFWVARRQAQNSADAGALAGAIAWAFDAQDTSDSGAAKQSALATAVGNGVWGQPPSVNVSTDIRFVNCPADSPGLECLRVDVYRDQNRGNPLPMLIGPLMGLTGQSVRATATARVGTANASDCLGPFAIPDHYIENSPPSDSFGAGDVYVPPSSSGPGTGYTVSGDFGAELLVKAATNEADTGPGWFRLLAFTGSGTSDIRDVVRSCSPQVRGIGDLLNEDVANGNKAGVKHAIDDLIALDPDIQWDPVTKTFSGGCVVAHSCSRYLPDGTLVPDPGAVISPRVLAIPLYDPALYVATGQIRIVNILGFFIWRMEGPGNKWIYGVLVKRPGLLVSGKGMVDWNSSFSRVIQLIR